MVNEDWGPEKGRLQTEKHDNILKGWAAKFNDPNQFIQFDLGDVAKVTGVATQGRSDADWMVTSYTLAYSLDGVNFTPYGGKNAKVKRLLFSNRNHNRVMRCKADSQGSLFLHLSCIQLSFPLRGRYLKDIHLTIS